MGKLRTAEEIAQARWNELPALVNVNSWHWAIPAIRAAQIEVLDESVERIWSHDEKSVEQVCDDLRAEILGEKKEPKEEWVKLSSILPEHSFFPQCKGGRKYTRTLAVDNGVFCVEHDSQIVHLLSPDTLVRRVVKE